MRGHYVSLLAFVLLFLCCWVHVGLAAPPPSCHLSVHLEWSARVGAPIHATPLVVDFLHDGHKEILVATQSNFLEALDGSNGGDAAGFPFAHPRLRTYASPLPIDMDGDGSTEWILAMYNGELVVFDERGDARGLLKVPPLAMKKNWRKNHLTAEQAGRVRAAAPNWSAEVIAEMAKARTMKDLFFVRRRPMSEQRTRPRRNVSTTLSPHGDRTSPMAYEDASLEHEDELPNWADDWITDEMDDDRTGEEPFEQERRIGPDGHLSEEAKRSMKLLFQPELYQVMMNKNTTIDESFGLKYIRGAIPFSVESDEIAVDPHILSTPVIADVDGNGDVDIILHMSYFFDEEEYAPGGGHGKKLPEGIIASDYAATAIVCMNLVSGEVKWARTLQVAPRHDPVPAQGLSTPLVLSAAKHNHGKAVIAVTSTDGTLTAFLGDGSPLPGAWPVTMNPILASPTAEDVERRGSTNICTGDTLGQVGCYRMDGTRIWNTTVVGAVADRIVYGDLLGNGEMCVVVVTTAGRIYAFTGSHGKLLPHFPIITGGPIYASPLLMNLQSMTFGTGLHIIVPSHDGHVYLVSPKTGCMDLVDIDEASSTSVLADDVSGNGMMDLIVTTIHGGVYLFETDTPHHPLKVWPSKTKGLNGFTANENNVGILLSEESRRTRDIQGSRFHLKISIVDGRPSTVDASHRIYKVTVFIGSRIRVYESVFTKPGTYSITVRAPFERMYAALTVAMELPNGQVFYDRTSLSFNMFFLETVKISVIVPFLLLASALMLVHRRHAV